MRSAVCNMCSTCVFMYRYMGDSVSSTSYVKYLGNLFGNRSLRLCTISSQVPEVRVTSMHLPIVSQYSEE